MISDAAINAQAQRDACAAAVQLAVHQPQPTQPDAPSQKQIERMQQFLDSGDPILIAEAIARVRMHQGVLEPNQMRLAPPQVRFVQD